MNKLFKLILITFTSSLTLISCQSDEMDITIPQKELREVIVTAQLADAIDNTRTSTSNDGTVYWSTDDKIKIFSAGQGAMFSNTEEQPTVLARFVGSIPVITGSDDGEEKDYVWGLYPYREDATYSEPDGISRTAVITTTLNDLQVAKEGTYADNQTVTIGRALSLSIPFKSAYTGFYVTFQNRDDIISVTFKGRSGEALAGRMTVGLDEETLTPVVRSLEDPKTEVTLKAPQGRPFSTGQRYYLIMLPDVTLTEGFSITARTASGLEGTYTVNAPGFKMKRNVINYVANLDTKITDWHTATTQGLNEIWYTTVDNTDLRDVFTADSSTGNEVDLDNCVAPAANDGIGIIRFKAPLTMIDQNAFSKNELLSTVSLPETVESIGTKAFEDCVNLKSISFGSSLKTINHFAFSRCGFTEINLPDGLLTLGQYTFSYCSDLKRVTLPSSLRSPGLATFIACPMLEGFYGAYASEDHRCLIDNSNPQNVTLYAFAPAGIGADDTYVIPEGVHTIYYYAFMYANFGGVVLPESLALIGPFAFSYCRGLKNVTIPSNVISMYSRAFYGSSNLDWIKIENEDDVISAAWSSGEGPFASTNDCPIYVPSNLLKYYKYGRYWDEYETRYYQAQEDNEIWYKTINPIPSDISVVSFNPSVYKLSEETGNELDIANCVLPEDNGGVGILRFKAPVTEIDKYAFSNTNIKEIILPDCVETIHQGAFEACQLLSDVTLGASLKSIGSYSFYGTSLSSITLPEGLERIGAFAFASTLLESITIPESVSHLGFREESPLSLAPLGNPFGNCPNLKRFKGKFSTQDGRALVENNKNGYSYFVSFATNGMDGQPYHVPEVYAVSPYAFHNATIGSVTLGGVETIFAYAFNNCGQLKSVVIPSNLTKIGGYAFGGCGALEFIEINSTQVPTAYDSQGHMFDGSSCPIYVRSNLVDAYKTTALWSDYEARYHFKQPEYAIWYKTNNGSVAPETLPDGFSRGADLPDGTKVIKYGSNITNIPNDFFINTTNLTEVFLPSEVVSIGSYAFANCQNLKNVHFGDKLTTIEMNAFQSCSSLNSIDLPESLTTLGTHVFRNCSNITTIRIPDALTSVSDNPFYFCDGLSSFTGTNNMISEDGRCLVKNGTLASFATAGLEDQIYTIPEGVTSIGAQAFVKANFNSVIIPETVRSIGWAAFYSNTHLTTIDIPSSVTSMSSWVFNGCSALYKVTLHNTTPPTLGNGVFNGTHSSLSIFVPAGSVEAYKTNSSWIAALNSVDVIQAIPTE